MTERPREAVEQKAVFGLVGVDALHDHTADHLVRHELAFVHVPLRLLAELRAVLDRLAQDVASRVIGQVEVLDEPLGLRSLAGPGRAEQDEIELPHEPRKAIVTRDREGREPSAAGSIE